MRSQPNTFVISAVPWDVFGTLTFAREIRGLEPAAEIGQQWLERLRVRMSEAESQFFWFLRPERGEQFGRVHLHVLIRVRPRFRGLFIVPQGMLCVAHRLWGRGRTLFRRVEDTFDPVTWYLQKPAETHGADNYELGKTARAHNGIPSCALLRRAQQQKSAGEADTGTATGARTLTEHPEKA